MPVNVDIEEVGKFRKLKDKTTVPDISLATLNEDPELYGYLDCLLDLSLGTEGYQDEGYGDKFHSLFDYLKRTSERGDSLRERVGADFVSNRRNLLSFAMGGKDVDILAIRKRGVIFLGTNDVDSPQHEGKGYKFERYMTLDEDGKAHDKNEKVSNAECEKVVFRTTISNEHSKLKVFYAAEVDAVDSDGKYVELKTTIYGRPKSIERQSLPHYFQAFFGNVSYIIYGQKKFKKDVSPREWNFVSNVTKVGVEDLAQSASHIWKAEDHLQQLHETLETVKGRLQNDDEAVLIKIRRSVERELGDIEFVDALSEDCTFLDQDFLDYFS